MKRREIKPTKPELPEFEEYIEEVRDIFGSGILTNDGPKLQLFRNQLKGRMRCRNVEIFANGHLALFLGIKSMGLPEGGEVLTSPFTFISTTNAIIQSGLIPLFCDVDETYNISIESMKKNLTSKTCAVITPHIFGIPCHVDEIGDFARNYGLKVIYDGAQAFGTRVKGRDIATYGDGTMFSMHAIKVFNSIEGGLFCYKDDTYSRQLVESRNFGISFEDKMDAEYVGINAKMDEFRAAMGLVNLRHVDEVIAKRKELADYYIEKLSDISGVVTYDYDKKIEYNYAYFPVKINAPLFGRNRDELFDTLSQNGIGSRKLYSRLTCDYQSVRRRGYKNDVPYARELASRCLDLPIYSTLGREDLDYITDVIKDISA